MFSLFPKNLFLMNLYYHNFTSKQMIVSEKVFSYLDAELLHREKKVQG